MNSALETGAEHIKVKVNVEGADSCHQSRVHYGKKCTSFSEDASIADGFTNALEKLEMAFAGRVQQREHPGKGVVDPLRLAETEVRE